MSADQPHRRTADAHTHWGAEALWEALVPRLPGLSIEIVERLDSTNSELAERLRQAARVQHDRRGNRQDDLLPQLLVATHQTAGRGRLGRRWHSTPGSSLTFSLALPLARADWSGLSLAVGLAVVDALDPHGRRLGLKWPNDLMLCDMGAAGADCNAGGRMGRKLGGILIESVAVGARRAAVIGIGVNVGAQPAVDADYETGSLSELDAEATPQSTLARLAGPLVETLAAFERDGFAPFQDAYARRDVLRGQRVRTSDATLQDGVAAGVDADGALRISAGGETRRVVSGEVSVRLAGSR
jgi:BirA family transcriptional regulator, biotin operon repressor / biotin---[acetyl-CoA-carboxylase] ligase